jgi:hypothetical protein
VPFADRVVVTEGVSAATAFAFEAHAG